MQLIFVTVMVSPQTATRLTALYKVLSPLKIYEEVMSAGGMWPVSPRERK